MTALDHTEAALSLLTTSGAYARVKRENPNRFEETALCKCARELEAAIADLTPPKVPSLVRTREGAATFEEPYCEDNALRPILKEGVWTCEVTPQVAGKPHNAISRLHWNETIPVGERFAIGARFWIGKDFRGTALRVESFVDPDTKEEGKWAWKNRLEVDRFQDGSWHLVRNRYRLGVNYEYTKIADPFELPSETWFDLWLEATLGGATMVFRNGDGVVPTAMPNWSTGNFTAPPIERVRFGVVEGSQSPPCKVLFASPYVERMT